jgi:hypothetical protein
MANDPESFQMVTVAQQNANATNALLSTGPHTPSGKLVVAKNAISHGIFAKVPVVMGEDETDWDEYCARVVHSLGAEGMVEVTLAERAASLFWRLRRLVRYESAKTAVAQERAAQHRNSYTDEFDDEFQEDQRSEERAVKDAQEELAGCRENHERAAMGQALLIILQSRPDEQEVSEVAARGILSAAFWVNERTIEVSSSPPNTRDFLTQIGEPARQFKAVSWTVGHLRRGLGYYAGKANVELAKFLELLSVELETQVKDGAVAVIQAGVELAQFETRVEHRLARRRTVGAVLSAEFLDKLTRYEAHLGRQLQQTLVQLERLQALRAGQYVAPPAVAEVGVTVTSEVG